MGAKSRGEEVALADLSGARLDQSWFRYINPQYGVAIDIPASGYRYDVSADGSGLTLISVDKPVAITVYANRVRNVLEAANNDARRSIAMLFERRVAETVEKKGTVTYSVKNPDFYVISGNFNGDTYYERLTISAECPAIFSAVRIFHPTSLERSLDGVVTRMSRSFRATCQGEEGAAKLD